MLTEEYNITYFCQAMRVNINLVKQLVSEIPTFATPDWDVKTVKYMQRLEAGVMKLEEYCGMMYVEASNGETGDVIGNLVHEMHTSLAIIRTLCYLLGRTIPSHDAALTILDVVTTYTNNIREIMGELLLALRSGE